LKPGFSGVPSNANNPVVAPAYFPSDMKPRAHKGSYWRAISYSIDNT